MMRSDEPATHGQRRPRWWQDLRWITAGIVVVLLAMIVWGLFGPEPPITVSRETTYLTEPLAADGLPDYGAALLASLGPAPRPEDNAAVDLLQVMWPLEIDAADLPAVCTALGIPNVPPADPLQGDPRNDAAAKVTREMMDAASERPWTAAEFPELAAWLIAREAALDRLVAAADRPRFWLPDPVLLRPGPELLLGINVSGEQNVRSAAYLLVLRAQGHVGAGRHAAAWRDIRAAYRLSRLLAVPENTPQFLVTQMVAIGINIRADAALTRSLLGAPDLPADVLAAIRRDLDALGPLPEPAASLANERLMCIDAAVGLARRTPGGRAGRPAMLCDVCEVSRSPSLVTTALLWSLDWDLVLQRINAEYDQLDAAARLPTHAARQSEFYRLAEVVQERMPRSGWAAAGHAVLGCCSRRYRSEFLGDVLCRQVVHPVGSLPDAVTRSQASFDLTCTAAALAAWKADRAPGEEPYPETLAALVPKYLAAVPLDPFSDKALIYERRGEGYLLASVGHNGVYDGGDTSRGWIVGGEWQTTPQAVDYNKSDLVVRMPVPPRPAAPATP
jgi:hypothetical protein